MIAMLSPRPTKAVTSPENRLTACRARPIAHSTIVVMRAQFWRFWIAMAKATFSSEATRMIAKTIVPAPEVSTGPESSAAIVNRPMQTPSAAPIHRMTTAALVLPGMYSWLREGRDMEGSPCRRGGFALRSIVVTLSDAIEPSAWSDPVIVDGANPLVHHAKGRSSQ
jgi:hypothetical protein